MTDPRNRPMFKEEDIPDLSRFGDHDAHPMVLKLLGRIDVLRSASCANTEEASALRHQANAYSDLIGWMLRHA